MRVLAAVVVCTVFGLAYADEAKDLPHLVQTPPTRAAAAKSHELNIAALTLHRKKQYDQALAKYREAIAADPSNTIARYNLASLLVTKGDSVGALAVLGQFRVASCAVCMQRLRDAQRDKEWQPLWGDQAFKDLVAFATPATTLSTGPASPVTNLQIEYPDEPDRMSDPDDPDGSHGDAPPAPGQIRVHVRTQIDGGGYYASPVLDIVVRGATGPVSTTSVPVSQSDHRSALVTLPGPGVWAIDVVQAGKTLTGTTVRIGEKRCAGGRRVPTLSKADSAVVWSAPFAGAQAPADDEDAHLRFVHHAFDNEDGATIVEWRHAGKVVVTDQLALQRSLDDDEALETATTAKDLDELCPVGEVWDDLKLPGEVRSAPGAWEARVYERDAPAYSLAFSFTKKAFGSSPVTVKPIATPKGLAYTAPPDADKQAVAAELRAMLRSPDAVKAHLALVAARKAKRSTDAPTAELARLVQASGRVFEDGELPLAAGAKAPAVARAALPRPISAKLPAISTDGTTVAFTQEVAYSMFYGQCAPPAGSSIEFYTVADGKLAPSIDVRKLQPMQCNAKTLPGGLKLVHPDDNELRAQVVDGTGKVLADLTADGGNGATTCVAPKQRVVLLLMHWGVGGDCSVVGTYSPFFAKY